MGLRKKVKVLIRDDRPAKLKALLSRQDADPCEIVLSRGRNVLHYCAEYGSLDMLRCLLQLECDPMCQDKDGRLPLHTALYRCIDEALDKANEIYEGIVSLLLNVSPMSQDMEDKDGATGFDLLKKLKRRLNLKPSRGFGETSAEEEYEWQKKLTKETQFEWEEQQPRYGFTEDYSDENAPEDFSSWSDRIYREYTHKKHSLNPSHQQSNPRKRPGFSSKKESKEPKDKKSKVGVDHDEELRNAREKMRKNYKPPPENNLRQERLQFQKSRYEKQFTRFFTGPPSHGTVTFGAIPWPCTNIEKLTETLFCDLPDKESSSYKKYLKREQVRWHPDKFLQKFREYLHPDHKDKIMSRVKGISQSLNSIAV